MSPPSAGLSLFSGLFLTSYTLAALWLLLP